MCASGNSGTAKVRCGSLKSFKLVFQRESYRPDRTLFLINILIAILHNCVMIKAQSNCLIIKGQKHDRA